MSFKISDTPSDDLSGSDRRIIWAFGRRSKYAHAFPGTHALDAGMTLCDARCIPVTTLEYWDLSRPEILQATCPVCLSRLKFARYMKHRCPATDAEDTATPSACSRGGPVSDG